MVAPGISRAENTAVEHAPSLSTARPLTMTDTPATRWPDILKQIASLRLRAVELKAASPDPADFMPAFGGEADDIVDAASTISEDALDAAHQAIDEILIELGYMDGSQRQT